MKFRLLGYIVVECESGETVSEQVWCSLGDALDDCKTLSEEGPCEVQAMLERVGSPFVTLYSVVTKFHLDNGYLS